MLLHHARLIQSPFVFEMWRYAVVLLIISLSCIFCCDRESFHNTTVTLVGVRGVEKFTGCFEPSEVLEKVSLIQIINETVPVVYEGAFKNLSSLVDIILDGDQIRNIYPGAFQDLERIYCIRIRNNYINEISEGIFNRLPLRELNLANNNISVIHKNAFNDMPELTILLLSSNKLRQWDSDWFFNTPKLSTINFACNSIEYLPARAFKNVYGFHVVNSVNVTTNIHLNTNNISYIDPDAFDGLYVLGWLFLHENQLRSIDQRVFIPLKQLDWLKLDHNQLNCVPDNLVQLVPNVKYYLEGNPLTDECKNRFEIKPRNGS